MTPQVHDRRREGAELHRQYAQRADEQHRGIDARHELGADALVAFHLPQPERAGEVKNKWESNH